MPIKENREYRALLLPFQQPTGEKRIDSDYYVEGYATTFNDPYVMWEWDGVKYYEAIDRNALDEADLSDVIMQLDHTGEVFARTKMRKGKARTLIVEPTDRGFFIAADLTNDDPDNPGPSTLYRKIDKGLIYQMSWAFTIAEEKYNKDTRTRTITKVKKVYDVSAVSIPANPGTDIAARSYFEGVIEKERQEWLQRQKAIELAKAKVLIL